MKMMIFSLTVVVLLFATHVLACNKVMIESMANERRLSRERYLPPPARTISKLGQSNRPFFILSSPDCPNFKRHDSYFGTQSKAKSGKACIDWSLLPLDNPHRRYLFEHPTPDWFLNERYSRERFKCRNPASNSRQYNPWCYTGLGTKGHSRWEECEAKPGECEAKCSFTEADSYFGVQNRAKSGNECLNWKSVDVQFGKGENQSLLSFRGDSGENANHSFCRNPQIHRISGEARYLVKPENGPWCYTKRTNKGDDISDDLKDIMKEHGIAYDYGMAMEYCDVWDKCPSKCPPFERVDSYFGTQKQTNRGEACLEWNKVDNRHSLHVSNFDSTVNNTYCRNPASADDTKPWCYTSSGWGYCDVFDRCQK